MKNPLPDHPIVLVHWKDAVDAGRDNLESARDTQLAEFWSVGWLIQEDEERLVIAHETGDTGEVSHDVIHRKDLIDRKTLMPALTKRRQAKSKKQRGAQG